MRKFIQSKSVWQITVISFLAFFATVGIVMATTTIGTNIATDGTLTVYGATSIGGALTATSTFATQGNSTFGNAATDINLFTGTLQASTTALFTGAVTLYNSTTTLADGTTISSGSLDGTTLRSMYIVPKASAGATQRHKLIQIDGTFGASAYFTYGLVGGFSRDAVAGAASFNGADTGFDLRVENAMINHADYDMQGAFIKATNSGDAANVLGSLTGLFVQAQNEANAIATTLIGVDIGINSDGTETTATGLNFRNSGASAFTDISLQYGETIDNKVDGVISLTGIASTTSIRLANLETIANSTDGTITLANDGGASISFTPANGTITPSTGTINIAGSIAATGTSSATTALVVPSGTSPTDGDSCANTSVGAIRIDTDGASGEKLIYCNGTNWQNAAESD